VLLIRRAKPPRQGQWSLPGGLQKLGETVYEAAAREVMEETGIAIQPLGIVDVVDLIERDGEYPSSRVRWHYTLIDVFALWQAGEPRPGTDAAEVSWVPISAVRSVVRWGETARIVEQAYDMCKVPRQTGNG
jgi:ADP-ribose pyrophosphatase YjhB (NUDIX family)